MNRTVVECPVGRCPWRYVLTDPVTESRGERLAERMVLVVPPPVGFEPTVLSPDEVVTGHAAARKVLDGALVVLGPGDPASEVERLGRLVFEAAHAQDQGVLLAHWVTGHSRGELEAWLPADALAQLDEMLAS